MRAPRDFGPCGPRLGRRRPLYTESCVHKVFAVSSPRLPPRLVLALGLVALDLLQDQLLLPVDAALPLLARGLASPVCHKGRKLSCSSTAPLQQRQRGALPRSLP